MSESRSPTTISDGLYRFGWPLLLNKIFCIQDLDWFYISGGKEVDNRQFLIQVQSQHHAQKKIKPLMNARNIATSPDFAIRNSHNRHGVDITSSSGQNSSMTLKILRLALSQTLQVIRTNFRLPMPMTRIHMKPHLSHHAVPAWTTMDPRRKKSRD